MSVGAGRFIIVSSTMVDTTPTSRPAAGTAIPEGALSMTDHHIPAALASYAETLLAGTGLNAADVVGDDHPETGSALHALRHGWDTARRGEQVTR
jgi:hypothetical protein